MYKKSKSGLWLRDKLIDQRGFIPGIMPIIGPQGGGVPPGTPDLWFKTPIVGLVNDDRVATWPDSSGGGHDATYPVSDEHFKPTYKTNVVDGFDALNFEIDGVVGSALRITDFGTLSTGWTAASVYIVVKADNDIPDAAHGGLWNLSSSNNATAYRFGADQHLYDTAFNTPFQDLGVSAQDLSDWHLYEVISNGNTAWTAYFEGVQEFTTGTTTFSLPLDVGGGHDATIGMDKVSRTLGGYIAEVLIYGTAHDTTMRQSVEAYFAAKYPTLGM